jgi:hypothetical protein
LYSSASTIKTEDEVGWELGEYEYIHIYIYIYIYIDIYRILVGQPGVRRQLGRYNNIKMNLERWNGMVWFEWLLWTGNVHSVFINFWDIFV